MSGVHEAAQNAVAVASLAYQEQVMALSRILSCAHGHGLAVDELVRASGLDEVFVLRLLEEAA